MTVQMDHRAEHEDSAPSLLLIFFALLTVGLIWLGVISVLGTNHPLEATVGSSMLPTLETGALVILRGVTPRDIRRGDIVAVHPSEEDQTKYNYPDTVMHRVERVTFDKKTVTVYTQGDNERAPDPFSVPASAVEGRLAYSIPKAGWILLYLRSKQGLVAVGGLFVLYLVYAGTKWITDEEPGEESASPAGFTELASAIAEYGEHLRSHTRVVQELGGTTAELHLAARTQNEVLDSLKQALMSERTPQSNDHAAAEFAVLTRPPRPVDQTALGSSLRPVAPRPRTSMWTKDSETSDVDMATVLSRVVLRGARTGGPTARTDLEQTVPGQLARYRLPTRSSLTVHPATDVPSSTLSAAALPRHIGREANHPDHLMSAGAIALILTSARRR